MSSRVDDLLRKYSANPGAANQLRNSYNANENPSPNRISDYLRPENKVDNYTINHQTYTSEINRNRPTIETFGGANEFISEFQNKPADNFLSANNRTSFTRNSYSQLNNQPASNYIPPVNTYNPPVNTYNPPVSNYNPPANTYNPPVTSYNPPVSTYNPPVSNNTNNLRNSYNAYQSNIPASNNVRENFEIGKYSEIKRTEPVINTYTEKVTTHYTTNLNNYSTSALNKPQIPINTSSSAQEIDSLVQNVIMGAELERLHNESNSLANRPASQAAYTGEDPLYLENTRLREGIRDRDFKMTDYRDENQRMKDREENLKNKLNELNEENKRLMGLSQYKNKGPWCC